jgi:hypothetical protein
MRNINYISNNTWNKVSGSTTNFHQQIDSVRYEKMWSASTTYEMIGVNEDKITNENAIQLVREGKLRPCCRPNNSWKFNKNTLEQQVLYVVTGKTGIHEYVKVGITTKKRLMGDVKNNRLLHMDITFDGDFNYMAVFDTFGTNGSYALFEENKFSNTLKSFGVFPSAITNRQGAKNTELYDMKHFSFITKMVKRDFGKHIRFSKEQVESFNEFRSKWTKEEGVEALNNYGKGKKFNNNYK